MRGPTWVGRRPLRTKGFDTLAIAVCEIGGRAVERHELPSPSRGQCDQVRVCDLPVAVQRSHVDLLARGDGHVVDPELMTREGTQLGQHPERLAGGTSVRDDPPVAGHPYEAGFRDRAGRPAAWMHVGEPITGSHMVDVVRPGNSDQDVDVG